MNSFTFNSKRFPVAFVLSIILYFLIQAMAVRVSKVWDFSLFYGNIGPGDPLLVEGTLRTLTKKAGEKIVFIYGSSQARQDLDVAYLNERFKDSKIKFYNIAVSGSAQPIDIFMMQDEIFKYDPALLIYMPFVESFYCTYRYNGHSPLRYFFDPKIIGPMHLYLNKKEFFAMSRDIFEGFLGRASPCFRYREQINNVMTTALKSWTGIEKRTEPMVHRYPDNHPADVEKEIRSSGTAAYYYNDYTNLNEAVFAKVAKDFKAHGIKLLVVSGPLHPWIGRIYNQATIDPMYDKYLYDQAQRNDFVYLSKRDLPEFTENEFIDLTHLKSTGRKRLTEFLADSLEKQLQDDLVNQHGLFARTVKISIQ